MRYQDLDESRRVTNQRCSRRLEQMTKAAHQRRSCPTDRLGFRHMTPKESRVQEAHALMASRAGNFGEA